MIQMMNMYVKGNIVDIVLKIMRRVRIKMEVYVHIVE